MSDKADTEGTEKDLKHRKHRIFFLANLAFTRMGHSVTNIKVAEGASGIVCRENDISPPLSVGVFGVSSSAFYVFVYLLFSGKNSIGDRKGNTENT
jgi:hypothetical protein